MADFGATGTYDTLHDLTPMINAGVRKVSIDIGVTAFDTVEIVDGQFFYTLNTNFIENGIPRIPFQVFLISSDGDEIQGLRPADAKEFGATPSGTSGTSSGTKAVGYGLTGNRFWLYPAGDAGDMVYIHGPAEGTIFEGTRGGTTNIYESDRQAVVLWAAYLLARERPTPNGLSADALKQDYLDFVFKRTGVMPTTP